MKDFIKKLLREALVVELKVKGKDSFNRGVEHILFASKNNPNILYKIGPEEIVNKWTKLFMSNPKLFPKIFKVGPLKSGPRYPAGYYYAVVEKLDTKRVENEWHQMHMAFDETMITKEEESGDPSTVFIDCLSTEGLFETYYHQLETHPQEQQLFKKWVVFLSKVTDYVENNGYNGLDIHRYNFAYDSRGNIKAIDV